MDDRASAKRASARQALRHVVPETVLGIGSGTTVLAFIDELADARESLGAAFGAVVASERSAAACRAAGIRVLDLPAAGVDLVIDGADAVTPDKQVLKGHGGALLREKILAAAAAQWILIVDPSKEMDRLEGVLPVEIVRYGAAWTLDRLRDLMGSEVELRTDGAGEPFLTDNGNLIANVALPPLDDPAALGERIQSLPGVVGHGLFLGFSPLVIVGQDDGAARER